MSENKDEKFDVDEFMAEQPVEDSQVEEPQNHSEDQEDTESALVEDEHPTEVYMAETRAKRPALTGDDIAGHYVQPTAAFEANKGSALPVEQRDESGNVVGVGAVDEELLNPSVEVTGYRKLSHDEISWMNTVKQAEIELAAVAQNVKELGPDVDPRMWAMARTHFQTGFMLLNRAIAKPEDPFDDRA